MNNINIFNLSFGKDSMATLLLAIEQGIQIDHVMYCDIRFSDEISGEHPLMAEWIPEAERILKERFGITVEHAFSITYLECFFKTKQKGKHIGDNYAFPHIIRAWCNSRLKIAAINNYLAQFGNRNITQFVGIAYDEPRRWERMKAKETKNRKYRSLLVEQKLTEQDAFQICEKNGLLSPIYKCDDGIYRGGCWFCPKQCNADLYSLWKNYPDYYQKLVDLEPYSPHNKFKPDGNLSDYAKRFENGYVPIRRKKRDKYVQTSIFDFLTQEETQIYSEIYDVKDRCGCCEFLKEYFTNEKGDYLDTEYCRKYDEYLDYEYGAIKCVECREEEVKK